MFTIDSILSVGREIFRCAGDFLDVNEIPSDCDDIPLQ